MPKHEDDDPFAGYGLPEELVKKNEEPPEPVDVAFERAATPPPPQQAPGYDLPPPAAFEVQPVRGHVSCDDCFHYVPGGSLAIDSIHEIHYASLYELATKAKEFEKSFEVRELKDIVEKAKTLDERFNARPRVRGYCMAGQVDSDDLYLIAEIKNHDGRCGEFLAGRAPIVSCTACVHRKPASQEPPNRGEYSVDMRLDAYDYLSEGAMAGYIGAVRGEYQKQEQFYQRDEQEYAQKLEDDVREAVFNDRAPDNFTLDYCRKRSYKVCAVANRSRRCTDFRSAEDRQWEEIQEKMKQGPFGNVDFGLNFELNLSIRKKKEPPDGRAGKNKERWQQLRMRSLAYLEESSAAMERNINRAINRPPSLRRSDDQRRIPCFDCKHMRNPVSVDPFETVHFNTPEIMALRDEHRRDVATRSGDEHRTCAEPGPSLGDPRVPSLNIWCDHYSRRQRDGKIQEYAYCYRALKNKAADGRCPGFEKRD